MTPLPGLTWIRKIQNLKPMKQITLLATVALALSTRPMVAATIYDNGAFTAEAGAMASDFDFPFQRAEDFLLQSSSLVARVNWWGQYAFSNTPQEADDFTLRIFGDLGGLPASSPLFQFSFGDPGRVDTGVVSYGSKVYAYSADLPSPVALGGGTTYWLSIVNNTALDLNDNWYWQRADMLVGTLVERRADSEQWGGRGDSTLAFNIQGAVVPEPATFTLLVAGTLLILATRKLLNERLPGQRLPAL